MPGHFTFYTHHVADGVAFFDESETRHAINALRYGPGQEIEFTDGRGNYFKGVISEIGKREFQARISSHNQPSGLPSIQLAIGIIKHADRLEWLIEKCTEMGVGTIYLMKTANSEKNRVNTERLHRVAVSALKQSHGCRLPVISVLDFNDVLSLNAEKKYIAHCRSDIETMNLPPLTGGSLVLIGPEGDFTREEVNTALQSGFTAVKLGNTILRSETAGMLVAAAGLLGG